MQSYFTQFAIPTTNLADAITLESDTFAADTPQQLTISEMAQVAGGGGPDLPIMNLPVTRW